VRGGGEGKSWGGYADEENDLHVQLSLDARHGQNEKGNPWPAETQKRKVFGEKKEEASDGKWSFMGHR